jgi:hypothetical protein
MLTTRTWLIVAASFAISPLHAQDSTPRITGNVTISIKKGTIAGDLTLTNLPQIRNYVIRLNSGLNIHYFKDLKRGGGALYYFHDYQPLSAVKTESGYGNREYYLYYYAPILFMAIHKEIGDPAMLKWLTTMVNNKAGVTDYPFLVSTLESAVADKRLAEKIESTYFTSPNALQNAIAELGIK